MRTHFCKKSGLRYCQRTYRAPFVERKREGFQCPSQSHYKAATKKTTLVHKFCEGKGVCAEPRTVKAFSE